ncbi:ribosome-associated translation inhibitor RaiA [Caulobacter vibrioides]|uniref:Ribosome hibernation promoting factor n=3 Tax=Caulobacter vibrioides TaxID=155892 RepID=H7C7J2_CAUVC|nr:ribosome-associated translation inhibitor RaiA [Caulobacter vibrioides]YP_002519084.1 ribosome-associated factor Y [Caulobacter vibrioides NA1000]AAC45596.1 unknown [Caulobacter vibrioides]AAK25559.1 ribosomal subunit interface protein [Caulobacter vibrioides CB15]ACL97176.1 ribosome-associated factor Y [Caulobacter vibrioides NA1000]ATC26448.1 ribosome-associated translation inhibitor RaiA [Caulobacter vibrioides]ATC30402.1 ribosome-associated translation inhibitor RaiA [Caulobacter vibri
MQVQVSGKHVDVGEALRARVSDEIALSIGKYFDRGGAAEVVVSKEGYAFRVDCSVKLASGQQLISHGSGGDAHAAFDAALAKIDTRIRRYKRRLKSHSAAATAKQVENAAMFVLRAPESDDVDEDWDIEDDHPTGAPAAMVIAETQAAMKTMTVSMAVMELDLTAYPAIVFRNAAHGGISVVYRRPDGNIGWIDPERTKSNGHGSTAS